MNKKKTHPTRGPRATFPRILRPTAVSGRRTGPGSIDKSIDRFDRPFLYRRSACDGRSQPCLPAIMGRRRPKARWFREARRKWQKALRENAPKRTCRSSVGRFSVLPGISPANAPAPSAGPAVPFHGCRLRAGAVDDSRRPAANLCETDEPDKQAISQGQRR